MIIEHYNPIMQNIQYFYGKFAKIYHILGLPASLNKDQRIKIVKSCSLIREKLNYKWRTKGWLENFLKVWQCINIHFQIAH